MSQMHSNMSEMHSGSLKHVQIKITITIKSNSERYGVTERS
jgi:hypothetical protein